MINYKELRIGNWIRQSKRNNGIDCIEEDLQVKNINSKGLNIASNECPIYYEWQWFESIPLTGEILEKCGFEKVKNGLGLRCVNQGNESTINSLFNGYPITLEVYGSRTPLWNIKYLHQLQNLYFALTGKELEYTP